jgi:Kef-type K+ transport system membrane component KefB
MNSIAVWQAFFGWCLVVNLAFYLLTAASLMLGRRLVMAMSARLFGIDEATAMRESFAFLGRFKLAIILFFLAPYIALRLMA